MRHYLLLTAVFGIMSHSNAQWKKIFLSQTKDLYDVQIIGNVAYAVGNTSALIKSTDTGKSWKNLTLTMPANLRAVYFLDSNLGFVTGENARIQKTTDGGKNWTQKYVRTAAYAYAIAFQNNHGVAVGKDMLAVSSVDLGENWTVDTTLSKFKNLNSVTILPDGNCWAVGDSGYVLTKKITSRKWKISKFPTKVDLKHVSHIGNSTLIIAGGRPDSSVIGKFYNILLISTDTGNTWQQNTIGEMKIINSAWFKNKDTGFLAGSNGLISKCTKGVSGRGLQLTGVSSSLNKVTFNNGIGLVVGDGGTLLRTVNNGGNVLSGSKINNQNLPVSIFPNPCINEFSIICSNMGSVVKIVNSKGQLVYSDADYLSGKIITIVSAGLYTIEIMDKNGIYSVRKLLALPY